MKSLYLPAQTREHVNFGSMEAYISFRPGFSAERQRFGSLMTIDDAEIPPRSKGFGFHPHKNVEVVTLAENFRIVVVFDQHAC